MNMKASGFDFAKWRIALPVDKAGTTSGVAAQVDDLTKYAGSEFFQASSSALTFRAMVEGSTTSGSKYARSELRELNNGNSAAWNLKQGGTMTATLRIDEAPTYFNGTTGKFVIGQIHGKNDELVRLYWDNGSVYFVNDLAGPNNKEMKFQLVSSDNELPSIGIGETFSYKINAVGNTLEVVVYADGKAYGSTTAINSVWQPDSLYFKAGVYLGVNETQGTGFGQATFYGLDFGHAQGQGLGGLGTLGEVHQGTSGDDQYDILLGSDIIVEAANGGVDSVVAHVDYTLSDNIETLTLADAAARGTGNGIANELTGTDGANWLYGMGGDDLLSGLGGNDVLDGGTGADQMTGGDGNDFYYVDNVGDRVIETRSTGGIDTVFSSIDFALDSFVENATALGTADIKLTGTSKGNVLTGNAGNNILDGGASTDTMIGGAGNDTYYVSTSADVVVETLGGGNDLVISSAGYVLADNVERLLLAGTTGSGTGNELDNELSGNASANKLAGMAGNDRIFGLDGNDKLDGGNGSDWLFGGNGVDQLSGGRGNDYFVFNTAPGEKDKITDFNVADDTLVFDNAFFAALGGDGQLSAAAFAIGKAATTVGQHLLYNSATGVLSYDADGSGSGAAVQIATLTSGLHLTSADFLVI
ncbi:MAG: polysaccharide lyase family 7 protein [Sphingobium sp.]|uniref:polysaccharide lyase family 7 protein n=1 Tax=Sphingobium sp. TaxID=1912891 RepID=UPI0029A3C371|nr:polysaccharide lyase family 7 protein [Sphingobium sp.]MDX3909060.1 polysaccharide lyase family 7 protein [Sphingobium sp.]